MVLAIHATKVSPAWWRASAGVMVVEASALSGKLRRGLSFSVDHPSDIGIRRIIHYLVCVAID